MDEPQESPITYEMLRTEWSWANEALDRAGVPTSHKSDGAAWTLASRVEWLAQQQAQAGRLAEDLRSILGRYDRRNTPDPPRP